MRKLTLLITMLFLSLGMAWAQELGFSTNVRNPERQYFITNGNNVKMASNTAPTQNNPGKFAFFETGVDNAYKIYSIDLKKWVSYDKTSTTDNTKNFATLVETQAGANAWKVTPVTIKGGAKGFHIVPFNADFTTSARYWNWNGGVNVGGGYSFDDTRTVGLWKGEATGDAGSGWILTEEVEYSLTDMVGNTYEWSSLGTVGVNPTLPGAAGANFSDGNWDGNKYTATINFPFPVSKEGGVINATTIASAAETKKWLATDNSVIMVQTSDYDANDNNWLWAIYPQFNNGAFTFKIKSIGQDKWIYTNAEGSKVDGGNNDGSAGNAAGAVNLSDGDATQFDVVKSNSVVAFHYIINNKNQYLSINSKNDTKVYLGVHTGVHIGSDCYFNYVKTISPVAQIREQKYVSLADAITAAQSGDEIVIIANVELTETTEFPAGKTITLNLNNKKVSAVDKNVIKNNGAALTIKNGTIERTGTVAGYAVNVVSGTLEVEDVTIVGGLYTSGTSLVATNTNISQASASRHAIYAYNCAVTINSGTYHNDNAGNATIFAYGSSVITIEDGTFSIDNGKQTLGWTSCMLDANAGGQFVINGGTFKGHFRVQANSAMEINGGTFENTHGEAYAIYGTTVVKGGTFTDAAAQTFAKNNIADDYKVGEDGKVVYAPVVAKIDQTKYETLEAAFAAAAENSTITLLNDATPALASQRAITKAAVIDLGGKTLTLTEDDLYFGTTKFQNGTIIVDPSVKPSTAVFWMFANQTLTFDNVKIVATGVTGTYLIGLDGDNSDLNLLNGSEILVENTTALDLDIICVNASTGNDIKVENSKVNVTNLDGRVFFRGNYTVAGNSEINLEGITKAGFRIEAGQTLSIEGTSKVNITGEPRDGGIHLTDLTATYTKAETATVNATVNEPKVAKVGENTYRTLAQAVEAVQDGGTITLIANETFTKNNRYDNGGWWDGLGYSGDKSFTIDLGGFTVSQDGSLNDYLFWFKNVGSKANTITIKNGTLDAGTTAYCALCTASSHENQLTINTEDLNIINNKSDGSTVKVRAGSILNVKEGTVITGKNSYLGIECSASTVNIYDGAKIYMNGTASYNGCLVGVGGNGVINVYGGYGKGVKGGFIAMTSGGTINVEGGEWIANTDGSVGNNSNLYVLTAQSNSQESGFAGGSYINVTGGSFRGGMDAWVLDASKPEEKAGLSISGGNFNANPTSYVAKDYIAVKNNDVWNVVKAAAKVGEKAYATLEAAFAAATEGQTITLLDDATPALTSQRAITKAAVIDLGGKALTLAEDDLYFGTTTFKNGTIVVDPSVKPSTAVFWMFANQTLTFDAVKVVATGVTGTYLIGLEGENSDLNLLNGSEILVENTTALDLDIICVNGTNTCDIKVENSKVNVKNLDGRVFFRGNYTVKDSEVNLAGITKAGFRIEAGQKLSIEGTSKVNIEGEPRDGGIHLTDVTAKYTKAADATVNATLNEPAKGSITVAYTSETSIWGEGGGNAKESLVIKVLDANDNVMGISTLNDVNDIIDGDVYVTWSIMFNAPAPNPEAYWSMEWTTAPSVDNMPAKVAIWVDGVEVGRNNVVLNGPDDLNKIVAAVTDAEGKIISCHTSVANAAAVTGVTNIALLRETNEEITLPAGVELNKNGFTATGVTVKMVAKVGNAEYSSIDKAIEAWTNGTTLTLLDNVTLSDVITLKSTEHHILNLGTYTMTAASGKNAFEIIATGTGDAERTAITIKADANNPGGINAGSKSIVYYDYSKGTATGNDRPIIKIEGGVFTASTSSWGTAGIYTKGTAARKCATLNISGGTFNCSINGSGKSKLIISGGVFNYSVGSQGDSTALRLISGGTFKSFGFMTADSNNTKFWFGTSMGNSNVGVHVDDNGYIVVGGAVVTEAGDKFEASSTNYSGANSLLQYSSAKDNGLYYTAFEEALADNNTASGKVTVYADEIDMSGISYKGTIIVPVGETVEITNAPANLKVESADGYVITPNANNEYVSIALVAKIGDKVYDKFEDAVAAAQEGETVTVHKAGTYALKVKNNITITGAVDGVEFANIGAFGCEGANVTFNNVTFTYANNSTYKGLQHSGNLVYNNCTFNGQVFLYGQSETFNKCTFNTTDKDNYNVWTYGAKNVAFNECRFNSAGKSVLIYAESTSVTNNVTVTKSQFIATQAVEGKAAIEMDSSLSGAISLTIDGETTAAGFGTGNVSGNSLWNNKKGNNDVANNDITVKVGDTVVLAPIFEAQIGDAQYRNLQDAINAVQNGETITVLRDIATNVEIKEKDNVKVTIDGNGMKMTGTIKVVALSSDNDRRITIKNFKFEDTTSASVDFITSVETNHYPRITVEGCTFTGSGDATDVALRLKSSKNVEIKNCTGKGLHSFLQNTSGWNLTIEGVTVTESKSAFALGTVQGVTIKGCEATVEGYGIRLDANTYNNNAVIADNNIKAFIPVVVRKANTESNVTVQGTNNLTATNSDGIWCAIGTSEYETNGAMPTAATGNVVVALNDAALDSKGIYGNALAGQGTAEAPYLINNIGELVLFRNSVNAGETKYSAPGVHVALAADIDLARENWVGIGAMTAEHGFMGNFDGKNFKIKNLTIDNPALDGEGYAYAGLFGLTEGTDKANQNFVKNLVIENVTINTNGKIAAAAIAYAYYTIVDNVKVCGDIKIQGGDYTAGVLAYTRRCVNASNLAVVGNTGSFVKGNQVVGGVISDIQMNGGLKAEYSNFSAEGVTVSGTKNVGGISGIIATQTLNGATVKNVTLNSGNAGVGIVAGCLGGTSTISNVTYENVAGASTLLGTTYDGTAIEAKIGDTYYATLEAALAAQGEATVELFVPVTVATGESRVIELNGKTVIGTDNATGSFALININPEAELTINGEGAIKLTATNDRDWNAYSSVISNQRGKLTVNGGTIEHLGGTDMAYAIDNLTNTGAQNAETVINGGTVKSTYRAIRQFLNSTSAQNVLTVNGGTIEGANKSIWMQGANANANPGALTVAAEAAIKGDVYLTTAAGTAEYPVVVAVAADALKDGAQVLTSNVPADFAVANVNGTWTKVDAAASLNGKGYATLRAAVEAAQNGETVELLANVTLAGGYEDATEGLRIEREITLNGNGHTIDCGTFQKGIRIYNLGTDGDFQVNFNNVEVVNNVANGRCIDTRSHDINLTITDSKLIAQNGNSQPLTIGGDKAIQRVKLDDAIIDAGNSGYGVIAFVPVKQNIYAYDDTKVTGYAAFYLKDHGNANIKLSLGKGTYIGKNIHSGASNTFGTVVLEGDNNILQIIGTNPTLKAITEGNASQAVVMIIGANNKVSLESASATIDIEGENAYYGMISAENAGTTTVINKGNTMFPVAEVGGFQFLTIKEAIRYAGNEGTIKAINDCVLKESWTVTAGQNITFDLNGKTVSYTSAVAGEDMITNRGNLTITDSSDAKTGKLAYVNTDTTASNVTVSTISTEAGSTLVVNGGTIENKTVKADGSSIYSYAIDILTNGNLGDVNVTINGGTVYSDYMAIRQFNNGTACKNSLTINGGNIYGAKRAVQVHMDNNAAYTAIKGGKVEAGAEGYALCNFAATGNLEVTGGEFIGAVYSARENFISGGIYNAEVYAGYCAEGYMPNKNVDGTYGVVLITDAYASIDGVTYGSLKAAVKAAKAGETITLLQDVKENVTISKNLTIDGAGKTITGMITTDGKSLKVTIKNVNFDGNNGTIGYAMRADDDLNLVVENCTASNYLYGLLYANKSNDKIVVKNVTVENCAEYGAYLVAFNNATFENFTVKGNTKYGIAVANAGARTVNLKNVTFEGAEQPLHINELGTGKVTFNFSGSNEMSKAEFYTSQYVKVVAAAQVGTKVCGSLQDAVVAANDAATVKVLADVNMTTANFVTQVDGYATLVNVAGKAVTIDLNGKKVTVNAANADLNGKAKGNMLMSVFHADPNGTLTLTDSSAEGTGTVELVANDATVYALIVSENANDKSNPGKIIVNGGNYIADRLADSMIYADINEVITVNGGNFHLDNVGEGPKGNGSPWIFNASGNNQMHINVNGGTYNANVAKQHWTYEVNLGEGLTTTNNGDGTWTVVPAVATVGEESFGSIQEAIDAAQDGNTVKLIADVVYTDADVQSVEEKPYTTMLYVQGKNIILDLNGKNIDVTYTGSLLYSVVLVSDGAGLTVTGEGSINVRGLKDGTAAKNIAYVFWKRGETGYLTIENGTFHMNDAADSMVYTNGDEIVTINGGTFILDAVASQTNGFPVIFSTHGNNERQIVVNAGTFNYDINHQIRPFEPYVAPEKAVKKVQIDGVDMWTIVSAQAYVTEMLGEWVTEPGTREHNVGYATVAEAIAATNNLGNTVTILAGNYTGNLNVNKGVTVKGEVDAEGNNLVTFNGKLSITADGATVENLNFNNSGTAAYVGAKNVTIDGCSLVGSNGLYQSYTSGTVTFKNSTITGATYGIHFDGNAGGNIVIENCTVTGWTSFAGTIENVAISGTTFADGNYNQLRFYQNAQLTGCTFNGKMNIDWGSSNKTAEFVNCSVEGDKELIEILSLSNIANKGLEVTIDGVPVSVAAKIDSKYYLSLQAAIDAATEGQVVTIVSDIALTEGVTVAADDNLFIDLNGKTITGTPAEAKAFAVITNRGTLTIEGNGSVICNHELAGSTGYAVNTITNCGTLTIDGATIENKSTASNQIGYAIDNNSTSTDATVTVVSGEVVASGSNYYDGIRLFCNSTTAVNNVIVRGGEVSTIWMQNPSDGATKNTKDVKGSVTIEGGTVGVLSLEPSANFQAAVTGGHVGDLSYFQTAEGRDLKEFVTGGTFGTLISENFLAWGYQLTGDAAPYKVEWTGRREVVTIEDGKVAEFVNEKEITVGTLTYKRTVGTTWTPLFVPFEIPAKELLNAGFEVGYITGVREADKDNDGEIDDLAMEIIQIKNTSAILKANHPYFIRSINERKALEVILDDAVLHKSVEETYDCRTMYTEYLITGNYSRRAGFTENDRGISAGNWEPFVDEYEELNPFRFYLTISPRPNSPYDVLAVKSMGVVVRGEENEDGTTVIYDVLADRDIDGTIYDLQGRKVLEITEPGIYIVNGKKVLVK